VKARSRPNPYFPFSNSDLKFPIAWEQWPDEQGHARQAKQHCASNGRVKV
jgi:acyl transferase domain-containing protein